MSYQIIMTDGDMCDELDLHGYTSHEARLELDRFIHDAQARGTPLVHIVVGKGTNSPDGEAVIPNVVRAYLNEHGLSYREASFLHGGSGTLEVTP